jgi:hypothetical protein
MAELAAARRRRLPSQTPLAGFTARQRRLAIVPGTTRARRPAPSCLGTTRHEKMAIVSCLGRHSGMRHGTAWHYSAVVLIGPGRIGPGQIMLGPCSGRAARLEYYMWGH